MNAAIVCALLAINLTHQPPHNQDPTTRGSEEMVTPPQRSTSGGMTLEVLKGLPPTRDAWFRPQPQVWVYRPTIPVYPTNSYGLGGYRPPGVGGYYSPGLIWWVR